MKKEAKSKIFFFILVIIFIIMIMILFISQKPKDLTKKMYNDICEKTKYTFSMLEENEDVKYNLIITKDEKGMCIDTISNGERTSTLVKDGNAYYIMHKDKVYYLYDSSQIDADILGNELENINSKNYKSGYETIDGKKHYYEEYEGIVTFILLTNYDENSSIRTRFYFDEKNIVYIKTFIDDKEELLKIDFSDEADESLFEIPTDYEKL